MTQSKKSSFRLNCFRLSFPTGGSSRKAPSKKFCTCLFNPSHRSSHHKAHTHTPKPGTTQQYHTTAPTVAWLSLRLLLAASQRGAFLAPLASSVYHTTTAARGIDVISPITATPAVALAALGWVQRHKRSFGGFRLKFNPLGRGFVARETRVACGERAKHRAANWFSTVIQQYSFTPTTSRKSTNTIKSTRLTIQQQQTTNEGPEESSRKKVQSKKILVEKGHFLLAESDCVRNGQTPTSVKYKMGQRLVTRRLNPCSAPKPLPILIPSNLSPKTGFHVIKALTAQRSRLKRAGNVWLVEWRKTPNSMEANLEVHQIISRFCTWGELSDLSQHTKGWDKKNESAKAWMNNPLKVIVTKQYISSKCQFCSKPTRTRKLIFCFSHTFTFQLVDKAVVTGIVPSSPRFLPSIFIAHR